MTDRLPDPDFFTSYISAHRWHVVERQGWDWECECGDKGHIASTTSAFVWECFARHAEEKVEQAAVALVLAPIPHTRAAYQRLLRQAHQAQDAGRKDEGNILMLAANERYHEAQEALRAQYNALEWYGWPGNINTTQGRAADIDDQERGVPRFWLYVHPSEVLTGTWVWETWLVNPNGDERKLSQGGTPSIEAAQEAAWGTVVKYREDLDDREEEPF